MTRTGSSSESRKTAALSRDLSEFLVELSIAVHRYAMYPEDHPSLHPAIENVIAGLTDLLQDRPSLSIGVARRQLLIEGVATDERHPVLSDLARRMHGHRLGGVVFSRGATLQELGDAVRALALDPERDGRPIGLLHEEERPSWPHVELVPIEYDRLEASEAEDGGGSRRLQMLWVGLARAAMGAGELNPEEAPGGRPLARIIEGNPRSEEYDEVIVEYLLHLAEELSRSDGADAAIREEVSRLIEDLDEGALTELLRLGAKSEDRRELLHQANRSDLGVDSVLKILRTAAAADEQTISSSLTRLLGKLASHADSVGGIQRAEAESTIRENVKGLISDWELADPNPGAYTRLLDRMAVAVPEFEAAEPEEPEDRMSGAERILKMALETDTSGPAVRRAARDLLEGGAMVRVFDLLDDAPGESEVAAQLRALFMTPDQLRRLLGGSDIDESGLQILIDRIGRDAIDPLYNALRESGSRAMRRKVFDALSRMGDDVKEIAVESLSDDRWYVKRNMLTLIQRMDRLPDGFSALEYTRHDDARVRREAFRLAFRIPSDRSRALASALADTDERVVRMALLELQAEIPETIVPVVVNRVLRSNPFPALRGLGVRALRNADSPLAREALLQVCSDGRTLLGRSRVAKASPEVIAGLSALARKWGEHPQAAGLLATARGSKDPRLRHAAEGKEGGA